MVQSDDDLRTELIKAIQELSALTQEYGSKNISATPLDSGPVLSMPPADLRVLTEKLQKVNKHIDDLKEKLWGS